MIVKNKVRVLSVEERVSRKTGNVYHLLNFMDGSEISNTRLSPKVPAEVVRNIVPFEEYEITFDFNLRYGSHSAVCIEEC